MKKKHYLIIVTIAVLAVVYFVFHSNVTLQYLFPEKVWSHKTNNLEKLACAKSTFRGIELDLMFDANTSVFDVNHPPDKSIGLSLANYIKSVSSTPNLKCWLDFKNLTLENQTSALARLDSLVVEEGLKRSDFIVESNNICRLTVFQERGYLTSYYLPSNIYRLEKKEKVLADIKSALNSCPQTYISTDYKDYDLISKYFPNEKKLIWFTVYGGLNTISARILLYKLLMDDHVDALLVPFHPN